MIFYTAIILIMRVDGFFIPCKTGEDCKELEEFGLHVCIDNYCITHDYFLEDNMMPPAVSVPTTITTTTMITTTTLTTTITTTTMITTTTPTTTAAATTTITTTTTTATTTAATRATSSPKAETLEPKHGVDTLLFVFIASFIVVMLLIILMGYIYRKRQLNYLNQQEVSSMKHDTFPDNRQEPIQTFDDTFADRKEPIQTFDLEHCNIENFDLMSSWEQNAHIWIDQQILTIKNENYKE